MKLTAMFLFLVCLQVKVKVNAQIRLSVTNEPLTKVIDELQIQSGYDFLFSYELLQQSGTVTATLKNVTLKQALDVCLKGKGLTFEIRLNTVLIKKLDNNTTPTVPEAGLPPPPVEITGRVISGKGVPLAGATIKEKGTLNVVQSKEDGSFTINVANSKSILIGSYIGFETLETPAANNGRVAIVLKQKPAQIEEVVVVGYGTQKKINNTGAVSSMTTKDLVQSPVANISNSLVGRITGLFATQSGGEPGNDASKIRIRGVGTFSGNTDPLTLVDGLEVTNINNIDPNEIETVTVLKDASSTAVYGIRGANGVILITTKRGKVGPPKISYTFNQGFNSFTDRRQMMNSAKNRKVLL